MHCSGWPRIESEPRSVDWKKEGQETAKTVAVQAAAVEDLL